jgi:hypothetical protein
MVLYCALILKKKFFLNFYLFLFFGGTGIRAHGFLLVKQALLLGAGVSCL